MELDAFAIPHGLKVIAGATFIGEHSYSTDKHPIAVGRPDESDLAFATEFGKKIMEKIQAADSMDTLYPVDVRAIKRPSQPFFPLFRFLRKVIPALLGWRMKICAPIVDCVWSVARQGL